jgi:hypothetical protein
LLLLLVAFFFKEVDASFAFSLAFPLSFALALLRIWAGAGWTPAVR